MHAARNEVGMGVKRMIDIVGAVILLVIALPLIAGACLYVALCSPGNPLFSQQREGKDGKPVRIWKIRTMVPNAEAMLAQYLADNPIVKRDYDKTLKLRHDPRIIAGIGDFLRSSSIDELPQLWNVLVGDLSLVGPRAMPRAEVDLYTRRGGAVRRSIRPGITGLWQVMYRNDSDLRTRERADAYYVRHWSLRLDLWILLRTVSVVVKRSGAY